jgi:hypothetical protein
MRQVDMETNARGVVEVIWDGAVAGAALFVQ